MRMHTFFGKFFWYSNFSVVIDDDTISSEDYISLGAKTSTEKREVTGIGKNIIYVIASYGSSHYYFVRRK